MTPVDLEPLGDQGVLARLAGDALAARWADAVRALSPPWLVDVVQAYSTVAVFHDPSRLGVTGLMQELASIAPVGLDSSPGRLHRLPCCYALGPDSFRVSDHLGLTPADVIRLHSGTEYTVRAIGFCPGFPYLGYLPPELCGVPRLETPRLKVEPGSVGLTGRQTGVYTETRPGGWPLIGRVPLLLVEVASGYFPLRVGDQVRFEPVDVTEYGRLLGRRIG